MQHSVAALMHMRHINDQQHDMYTPRLRWNQTLPWRRPNWFIVFFNVPVFWWSTVRFLSTAPQLAMLRLVHRNWAARIDRPTISFILWDSMWRLAYGQSAISRALYRQHPAVVANHFTAANHERLVSLVRSSAMDDSKRLIKDAEWLVMSASNHQVKSWRDHTYEHHMLQRTQRRMPRVRPLLPLESRPGLYQRVATWRFIHNDKQSPDCLGASVGIGNTSVELCRLWDCNEASYDKCHLDRAAFEHDHRDDSGLFRRQSGWVLGTGDEQILDCVTSPSSSHMWLKSDSALYHINAASHNDTVQSDLKPLCQLRTHDAIDPNRREHIVYAMSGVTAVLHHASSPTDIFVSTPLGVEQYDTTVGAYIGVIPWPREALDTLYQGCKLHDLDRCGPYAHSRLHAYDIKSMVVATDGNNLTAWDQRQPKAAMQHQWGAKRAPLSSLRQLSFDGHTIIAAQRYSNHIALDLSDIRCLRAGAMATFTLGGAPLQRFDEWSYIYDSSNNMVALATNTDMRIYTNLFQGGHSPQGESFPGVFPWSHELSSYNNIVMLNSGYACNVYQCFH
jgi:hypothetical protein